MCYYLNLMIIFVLVDWLKFHVSLDSHTHTQPFYGSVEIVWDNPREPVPEETFTLSHLSWTSVISYLLPPSSVMIHSILPVQFTCLTVFPQSLSKFSLFYLLAWHPPLHTPYISSPNHCLLFAAHAYTITTCFAVVPRLSSNPSLSLNPLLGTLSCSLMSHIHPTILISVC